MQYREQRLEFVYTGRRKGPHLGHCFEILALLDDAEDGRNTFLQNVGIPDKSLHAPKDHNMY
jgi:hypothetical protein